MTQLNPAGTALVYSSYLGGTSDDEGDVIAVDKADIAYVTGLTDSKNFPITPGAFQTTYGGGNNDAFVTQFDRTGARLAFSTYLGGSAYDEGDAIALDRAGGAYVTGVTNSTNFPHTARAFQPAYGGGSADSFVTKFGSAAPTPSPQPQPQPRPQPRPPTRSSSQQQSAENDAVAGNNTDSAVTGGVATHAHDSGVHSSISRVHQQVRRRHSAGRHRG